MALNTGSRTGNSSRNAASAFINKFVMLLLTFVNRKIFITFIGVEYLGISGLFANILTLLSMADLGLGTAMNVSLYKPIAENDTKKLAALLGYFRKLYYIIAAAVMVIGLGLTPFLDFIVNLENDIPYLELYYILYVVKSAVSYLFAYKASIIHADQKKYIVTRIDLFINIAKVLLHIGVLIVMSMFLDKPWVYFVYLIVDVAAVVVHNMVVSHVASKNYPFIRQKQELDKTEQKEIFSGTLSVFIYKIAWSLINGTDNILISVITGTVFVGLYSNYSTITSHLEAFITLFFTALTASIGNLVVKSLPEKRYKTFKTMQMVSFWICAVTVVCLSFLMQDFVQLWYGEDLILSPLVVFAIILNVFFSICMRPVWTFREGTGMYRQIRYIMLATAALNLILSIIMGKWLGLAGILLATSLSKLATYFWYEPKVLFKSFFEVGPSKYYVPFGMNMVLILLSAGMCWLPINFLFREVTWINWFIKAFICLITVNAVYFLCYRKTDEFAEILNKTKSILGKKFKKNKTLQANGDE